MKKTGRRFGLMMANPYRIKMRIFMSKILLRYFANSLVLEKKLKLLIPYNVKIR